MLLESNDSTKVMPEPEGKDQKEPTIFEFLSLWGEQ